MEPKRVSSWPSAIVFDLDGTLVDSAGDLIAALNELLAAQQLSLFRAEEAIDERRSTELTRTYAGVPELISNLRTRGIAASPASEPRRSRSMPRP
jgi:phosphoglycolate phosphatase-like HAD superfamily hydrolase